MTITLSRTIKITKVKKRSAAKAFKNVEVDDVLKIEFDLVNHYGRSPKIKVTNLTKNTPAKFIEVGSFSYVFPLVLDWRDGFFDYEIVS